MIITIDKSYALNLSKSGRAYSPPLLIIRPQSSIMLLLLIVSIMHDLPTSHPAPKGNIETFCIISYILDVISIYMSEINKNTAIDYNDTVTLFYFNEDSNVVIAYLFINIRSRDQCWLF